MIRRLVTVVVLACLTLAGWSVWRQLDRPVRSVRVEGMLSAAEQGAIRDVVSRSLDSGVLSLDVATLGERIRELSWPRAVEVRRVWPDTLVIRVEKESVVAAWGDGGYLTSAGKVVQLADGAAGVPELATTLSAPRRAMEVYQMLESRVNPAGFSIVRLEENSLGEWLITLDGGTTLALGNEAVMERLERFLLAYRKAFWQRHDELAHVDLRYDNGLAVRWREIEAATAAATVATVGAISRSRTGVHSYEGSRSGDRSHSESRSGDRSHSESRSGDRSHSGMDYAFRQ